MNVDLAEHGVDPGVLVTIGEPPFVDRRRARRAGRRGRRSSSPTSASVLILVGIFSFGFTVLTGVVEEKQSRVVEVVLSTVRPRDLLMGKVLGIGVLGLVQLAAFVVAGVLAVSLTGEFSLPATTPTAVAMISIWFILGYLLYSTALGSWARSPRAWRRRRTHRLP